MPMKTTLRASIIAAAIAALPLGASAAGLGRLNVFSGLGQPLRAEVEVTGSAEELDSLSARLASPEAFRRANIEYAPQLSALRLSIEKKGAGAVVKVASDRPFSEPFVDLLLELNWTGGRLVREYTFLLDPVDEGVKPAAPQVAAPVAKPLEPNATPQKRKERTERASKPAERAAAKPKTDVPGSEYTVQSGDSLTSIAARTKANDVSLEQMLAALYSSNESAFPGGDINRLKTGQILKVPESSAARELSASEARRILSAPSANFGAYRQKAAAAVADSGAKESAAQQSASGKITPKVEDAAKAQEAKDQLKISKSQVAKDAGKTDPKAAGRIQALEEDLVARERALKEATERVAALEKNVKDLQKLVDLKNQNLADLQKQAAAAKTEATKPAVEKAPESEPAKVEPAKPVAEQSVAVAPTQSAPVEAPATAASAPEVVAPKPAPKPVPKKVAPPPPPVVEEPGFFASLLENPAALGGLAAVLGLGGFLAYRSRKPKRNAGPDTTALNATQTGTESVIGPAGGQTVDTGSSVLPTDFSQSGLTSIDADEGVDPVAEADVYMAYGRDAQAEEILLDALKSDPSRTAIHVKLLEIYSQRKSLKQFENIATDLYTQTGGVGTDWVRAADLGTKLDPENPLYRSLTKAAAVAAVAEPAMLDELSFVEAGNATAETPQEFEFEPAEEPANKEEPAALEFTPPEEAPAAPAFAAASPSQMQTTWTMPGEIGQITRTLEGETPAAADVPAGSSDDLGLDFNLDIDMVPGAEPSAEPESLPDLSAAEFSAAEVKLSTTNLGSSAEQPMTLDLDGFDSAEPTHDEVAVTSAVASQHEAVVDLEKTNFEGGLLDFDFDVDRSPQTLAAEAPPLDLSGIDLDLPAQPPAEPVRQSDVDTHPELPMTEDDFEVGDEVNTKLELARAYEEMRDFEGAKELLEEVMQEGTSAQKDAAEAMLARLS